MTVHTPSANVRGGRSEIFPITGYLRQGQSVHIVNEDGDFYGVLPPPGSSSGSRTSPFARTRRQADHDQLGPSLCSTTLSSGSAATALRSRCLTKPSSWLAARSSKSSATRSSSTARRWWRIQPPPGELRFIAKDSLNSQSSTVVAASPVGTLVSQQPARIGQSANPLWLQAQQAEQNRDYAKAEALYRQLASEMAQPNGDHDLAIRCYNRIEQLTTAQSTNWPARTQTPGMLVSGRPVRPSAAGRFPGPRPDHGVTCWLDLQRAGRVQRAESADRRPAGLRSRG